MFEARRGEGGLVGLGEPGAGNGFQEVSYARCEDVHAVSEERLARRLGAIDVGTQPAVERTLWVFLEL